jgi:hypothetical protein
VLRSDGDELLWRIGLTARRSKGKGKTMATDVGLRRRKQGFRALPAVAWPCHGEAAACQACVRRQNWSGGVGEQAPAWQQLAALLFMTDSAFSFLFFFSKSV